MRGVAETAGTFTENILDILLKKNLFFSYQNCRLQVTFKDEALYHSIRSTRKHFELIKRK